MAAICEAGEGFRAAQEGRGGAGGALTELRSTFGGPEWRLAMAGDELFLSLEEKESRFFAEPRDAFSGVSSLSVNGLCDCSLALADCVGAM